ncbi:MAG: gliding motility-associated C-terminal domain-containing protein [Bacteroidales bacterium]
MKTGSTYQYFTWLLAVIMMAEVNISGQITSPQADAEKSLSYPVHPGSDPLFVFYQSNGTYRPGSLVAAFPEPGTYDFVWTLYDPGADGFTIPVKSEIGTETSSVTGLGEGGYMVQISNGLDVDTSFLAWIMLDSLVVWTEKNADGKLESFRSGCSDGNYVIIAGGVDLDTYYYYDPDSHEAVLYENDFDIQWTSDNPDLTIYNPTDKTKMGANFSQYPPYRDTYYILTASDSLGMTEVDSVLYDTKHTRAEFTVEYQDKVTLNWEPDLTTGFEKDKGSMDAPLSVRFTNESENGFEFTWVYLDTTEEVTGISYKEFDHTPDLNFEPEFTYYRADRTYYPYLVSVSDAGCVDTFHLEDGIRVVPSDLAIPNVFTPNGDGTNDVFNFKHQSLKECRITISDRFGRVVYRKRIDNIYEWEGWTGTVLNSDRDAPEGQYYYVVEGIGYDHVEYKDPNFLEQRKLDRQQNTGGGNGEETQSQNLYTGWIYLFRKIGAY